MGESHGRACADHVASGSLVRWHGHDASTFTI